MEFYTSFSEKRPVRLSESTRAFAYESLCGHRWGLDTKSTPAVMLDHIENFTEMSDIDKYDAAIYEIAAKAPVRICDDELISGAATLGEAISHKVPATYGGECVFRSISHLTLDFPKVLRLGLNGIRAEVNETLRTQTDPAKRRFLESCINCLNAYDIWHKRYTDALNERQGYDDNIKNLTRVPYEPPRNFYEAVQSLWIMFAFERLCGNWPGIGRIDQMLGEYLKQDLEAGVLTLDKAREILAHMFIKGCEWVSGGIYGSGDAQHYQNIVMAGIDENGREVTNEVTYLVLDIVEELGISDFPITMRFNKNTDGKLIRRVSEVMRYGNGIVAVYNEDLVLRSLVGYGYDEIEARKFANDGCWEVQIPGKTYFGYLPFDSLALLQRETLKNYSERLDFYDFEELYKAYISDLRAHVEEFCYRVINEAYVKTDDGWKAKAQAPCTVVSLLEEGCIKNGVSYLEGGAKYYVKSPHIGGIADTVNSLYIIKKLVYDEKKLSLDELMDIVKADWTENEQLRQYVLTKYSYYGNDNDEVDALMSRLLDDFADICAGLDGKSPISFPAGVSTFGRQIAWAQTRLAAAHGRKKGDVLAGNMSPTPGTGTAGATAIIKSYCKADLSRQVTGAALDIRLLPADVKGEQGISAISSLIRGFVTLGGYFMQIDVADAEILKDAQKHPENYQSLAVRISGWNARFVTLSKEWQDMVIKNICP